MFARIDAGLNLLYRTCGYLAALCMVTIAVMVLLSITSRLLSVYIPGLTEYSGYAMAAGSFLALAYTFGEGGHIRVELVLSHLSPAVRRVVEVWCLAVAVVVSCFLAWYMARMVYFSWKFEERSEGADAMLQWQPQSLVMFGAMVLAVATIHHLVKCLARPDYSPR